MHGKRERERGRGYGTKGTVDRQMIKTKGKKRRPKHVERKEHEYQTWDDMENEQAHHSDESRDGNSSDERASFESKVVVGCGELGVLPSFRPSVRPSSSLVGT
jgi:hypothetical protein